MLRARARPTLRVVLGSRRGGGGGCCSGVRGLTLLLWAGGGEGRARPPTGGFLGRVEKPRWTGRVLA